MHLHVLFICCIFRLRNDASCCVDVREIYSQYGVQWPIRWKGFFTMQGCSTLCLANLLALSFPMMFVWALTLQMVILW